MYTQIGLIFQDKDEHLELMDGVVIDLLNAKWNTFVKKKFYRQFFTFAFYFVISLICFTMRPGPPINSALANTTNSTNTTLKTLNISDPVNLTFAFNDSIKNENISSLTALLLSKPFNSTQDDRFLTVRFRFYHTNRRYYS